MVNQFQNKFTGGEKPTVIAGLSSRKRRRAGIFFILGVIIFILSVGSAVGLFFWQQQVLAENKQMTEALEAEKELFDQELVRVFTDLKTRVEAGEKLINDHLAVSAFLNLLSELTVTDVRFNDFNFSAVPGGMVSVNMSGRARSYGSLAFQSRVFEENASIRNFEFSNLNLDLEGNVIFNVVAEVDPSAVSFRANLTNDFFDEILSDEDSNQDEAIEDGVDEETDEGEDQA